MTASCDSGRSPRLDRWQQFWFEPVPPHAYAALRIGFGLLACATLIGLSDLETYWDIDGFVPHLADGRDLTDLAAASGVGASAGRLLYGFCWVAFLATTVGLWTPFAVPLAFGASLLQASWNDLPLSAADAVIRSVLFCLIWADSGQVWSVDSWRSKGRGEGHPTRAGAPIAGLRLVRFQVSLVYLSSGLWKLLNPAWQDGSALRDILHANIFHRMPIDLAGLPSAIVPVVSLATYATVMWEVLFPVLMLVRRTRLPALAVGVVFHLGVEMTLEIGLFSYVMLASYIAFLDPRSIARVGNRFFPGVVTARSPADSDVLARVTSHPTARPAG